MFINRPILAMVISIVIVLLGVLSIPILPVSSMPDITPPTVKVTTTYPGANAVVVEETVTAPIEQQVNGVENMLYMASKSGSDGTLDLTVTFEVGTDPDMATVLTQNRVNIAMPVLPQEVSRQGVKVEKQSTQMVMVVSLIAPDGRYDDIYLSNYATTQIKDVLARLDGVGLVQVFGAKDFGMRIWIDPAKLKARDLTSDELILALQEQNVQVAAGQIGAPPNPAGLAFQYNISTLGRLTDASEFENIIVKVGANGEFVRVRDVARVELGAQNYTWYAELDGAPSIAMGIYQLPGANAVNVRDAVEASMNELSLRFPEGLEYVIPHDTTRYIKQSIAEVITTLLMAVVLVILVVFIFLQDWRATLVPTFAHSRVAGRHVRGVAGGGLLYQQPEPVRIDPGHRNRRGRLHHGDGKHDPDHGRRRPTSEGGRVEDHVRGGRGRGGHDARAPGRVHPDHGHARPDRDASIDSSPPRSPWPRFCPASTP